MRAAFNKELLAIAKKDPRVHMILADIGYGEIEGFANAFPERFINCGVAEQNMTGVACGVAMEGNIAITYSIANFPTLRCLEQIRNDVCYHNANVKIVIIGGGMAYGPLGISHHSTEDLAIMRALPNMVVIAPCDIPEAIEATRAMMAYKGPVYYRCGYKKEPNIYDSPVKFKIGRANIISDGSDATMIFAGTIGYNCKLAVEQLARDGVKCRLVSMHTVKPLDVETVKRAATETGAILTVEEHNICGGLGSAVAEALMDSGAGNIPFKRLALPDVNVTKIGSQKWLCDEYGLGVKHIVAAVKEILK
ncbi:MAG: transketolase C-terminal domain-containing protein [Kiritimatiellae bacterium]|nr:transketolase C-terminal domain-containing protein [Kiritimatiellia bacterium]MDD5522093.1 transketolase C-terminal domain-containing protein [Kiritimatiellia bacterium]